MTSVTVSAPGKLVLMGEYAVLEGAPALVAAVNRRAVVRAASRDDGHCTIQAPDIGVADARLMTDSAHGLRWSSSNDVAAKLGLFEQIFLSLWRAGLVSSLDRGFDLHLDTHGFFDPSGSGGAKLGLGSSAALTVALASALVVLAGHTLMLEDRAKWLRQLFQMHASWQGNGSGVDLAASIAGGMSAYHLAHGEQPTFSSIGWPIAGVHTLFVWAGESVSTGDYLARLAQWRVTHGPEYVAHMRELGAISESAIGAAKAKNNDSFVMLADAYAKALRVFGDACGLRIFSAGQERVATLSTRFGASFKPCGAGGDMGVVFATDVDRLASVATAITAEGFHCVPLKVDPDGLIATPLRADSRLLDEVR